MGKGTIISGGAAGLYNVQVNLDRSRIVAELARLATAIVAAAAQIAVAPPGPARDSLRLAKLGMEKRRAWLEKAEFADPTIEAWCADLTEDLTGAVATIEINGERGAGLLIAPGFGGGSAYDVLAHGQLQPVTASTPAATFYNLAMMPGWQKWRPTYRVGEITALAGDTCDVALDPAAFSDRGSGLSANLNINQNTESGQVTLTGVPIHYMNCDGRAFVVGDRVVVHFIGQDWAAPEVVGFVDHPQPCAFGLLVVQLTGALTDPQGAPAGGDGPPVYLLWGCGRDALFPVPKSGGGVWDYPLSEADYLAGFLDDLAIFLGAGTLDVAAVAPLFTEAPILTDIRNPRQNTGNDDEPIYYDAALSCYRGQDSNGVAGACADWGPPAAPNDTPWTGVPVGNGENCCAAPYDTTSHIEEIAAPLTIALNSHGIEDSWAETGHRSTRNYDEFPTYINQDADPDVCWRYANGNIGSIVLGSDALSFSLPSGGIVPALFLGYPAADYTGHLDLRITDVTNGFTLTKIPAPCRGHGVALTCQNNSGAAVRVLGPQISYAGEITGSNSQIFNYVPDGFGNGTASISHVAQVEASGAGTLTTLDGSIYQLAYEFGEYATMSRAGYFTTWQPLTTYLGVKLVDYATDSLHIASACDPSDNLVALIVIESVGRGSAEVAMAGPAGPGLDVNSLGTEGAVLYSNQAVGYHILAVAEAVADADSQDPWALEPSANLAGALQDAIALYLTATPPGGVNHWRMQTVLGKVVWTPAE